MFLCRYWRSCSKTAWNKNGYHLNCSRIKNLLNMPNEFRFKRACYRIKMLAFTCLSWRMYKKLVKIWSEMPDMQSRHLMIFEMIKDYWDCINYVNTFRIDYLHLKATSEYFHLTKIIWLILSLKSFQIHGLFDRTLLMHSSFLLINLPNSFFIFSSLTSHSASLPLPSSILSDHSWSLIFVTLRLQF